MSTRAKEGKYYGGKEGYDADVMLESKAMLSKEDYVATGVLTYALGDIIEVELTEYDKFALGDKCKMTVYTKSGLFVMETAVVAKEQGSVIVLNPPENRKKFTEKREFPRVDVKNEGLLFALQDKNRRDKHRFDDPIRFAIRNISVNGLGFTIPENTMLEKVIQKQSRLEVELILGFLVPCTMEIVRQEKTNEGWYYGASFVRIPDAKTNALRGFILKNQIETYFVQKRENETKKALEKKSAANQ
ncbi:PilZ domain-containing protein [Paenibacillus sp. GCM10023248]|uniref:PilZ domain-containing protein n=1 Tax=Bacillales TaxID=1385 RepID=UPI00237808F4|nr:MULTISPECIES: PilZ domain-containing protein [Bacillales]MDD9271989.1 PilZ domain-containing protein [Paenibacillus sp. MAHUQ-63]MDR6883555.1 c-di-GMP-binding flagellar brake protein YcgR [Bacillus sp. 3255]